MNPETWAAVGAVVGVLSLGATLILHIIKAAEKQGENRARLSALEDWRRELGDSGSQLATLNSNMTNFGAALERIERALTERVGALESRFADFLMGRQKPNRPPSRQREGD